MKAFIVQTKNIMTTAYYYDLIEKSLLSIGIEVTKCYSFKDIKPSKNDIIVCGHRLLTFKAYIKGYRNLITWYQGAAPEERAMQGNSKINQYLNAFLEWFSLRKSKYNIFVSNAIREHFEYKYHVDLSSNHYTICPCFNEYNVSKNCFEKDAKKPYSFVYSGGLGAWQCFEQTLRVYKIIKSNIPESTFSVFTFEVEKARKIANECGLFDVDVKYVNKEDMNNALKPFMYGFVLREESVVNKVATPTKLSNYVSNGVIPICSSVISDFTKQTSKFKYVVHINEKTDEGIAHEILSKIKSNFYYNCKEHYEECELLFSSYYCTSKYIGEIGKKVNSIFS